MPTITDWECLDHEGKRVPSDAFGNNVALACPTCRHPVLAIARETQRGASADNPAVCRGCGFRAWIEIREAALLLHAL